MPSTCHGVVWHGRYCVACPAPCTTPISGGFTRRCLGDSDPPSPSPPTHHTQGTCISGERGVLARSSCGWRPVLALRRRDVARGNRLAAIFVMFTPIQGRGATAPRPNSKHAASSALTLLARLVMCDFIAMRAVCADSPPVDLAIVALVVTSGAGHFAQLLARHDFLRSEHLRTSRERLEYDMQQLEYHITGSSTARLPTVATPAESGKGRPAPDAHHQQAGERSWDQPPEPGAARPSMASFPPGPPSSSAASATGVAAASPPPEQTSSSNGKGKRKRKAEAGKAVVQASGRQAFHFSNNPIKRASAGSEQAVLQLAEVSSTQLAKTLKAQADSDGALPAPLAKKEIPKKWAGFQKGARKRSLLQ
jgi:hypothetical protein